MTKKIRKISTVMALALSLTLLAGCGKKNKDVDVDKMIDKYSAYCQLGEYKGLKYTLTNKQRTEEDLQYQIDYLLYTKSTTEDVTGAVESGDSVNIDFVGTIDGEEFEGGSTQGNGYDLQIGSGKMIPGFEDGIIGHSVGETFDIDVTFPEDYKKDDTSLNGKDAVFKITINSAKRTILPEYNDEFVAANTDYATVAEYETKLKEDIDKSYADSNASYNKSAIITLVEENAIITEYPEKELQELIDEAIESTQEEAASYGYDLATYVVSRYGMASEESFREYVAKLAESYMREKILICAIAKAEGITATKEDISVQKSKMLEQYGIEEKELKEHYSDEDIAYYALSENVYNFLLDNSTGEEATTEAPTTETTTEENTEATSTDASATDAE